MCRTSQALYVWCQCEESHILETCHSGRSSSANRNRSSNNGSCDSVDSETVYLHCFCHYHSTNGFTSIKKDQKLQRKADKKKNKRRSMDSATSVDSLNSSASTDSSTVASSAGSSMLGKSPGRFRRSWMNLRRLSFA
jgi:hypothetical protein